MSWKRTAIVVTMTVALGGAAHAAGKVTITPPSVPANLEVDRQVRAVPGQARLRHTELHLRAGRDANRRRLVVPWAAGNGVQGRWSAGPHSLPEQESIQGQCAACHVAALRRHQHRLGDEVQGSTDSAYVAPGAIEWLLLEMTGAQVGPNGGGKLAATRFIQRVNTVGGVKPAAADCTASTLYARRLVDYEADYYFYR